MYCDISDIADIPRFYRTWQQGELERLSNTSHIGIGSYGRGTTADKWDNETPWISLASLRQYTLSLLDIYNQMIHDIRNGTYDSSEDIPNTYSDAWEQTISGAWDDVVEQSSEAGPADGSKDDTNGEDSDIDKDKDKDEPDAPIEGEGTEKPGEGGGSDTDPPTEGEDPDPKEPPEGDGGNTNPDIQDIIKRIPDELKAYGKCDEFAQSLVDALEEEGIAYKIIRVDSEYAIYSDKFGGYIGVEYHYGVQVGNTVYDNLTTYGMLLEEWLEDLGLTQGFSDIGWKYVLEIFNK